MERELALQIKHAISEDNFRYGAIAQLLAMRLRSELSCDDHTSIFAQWLQLIGNIFDADLARYLYCDLSAK